MPGDEEDPFPPGYRASDRAPVPGVTEADLDDGFPALPRQARGGRPPGAGHALPAPDRGRHPRRFSGTATVLAATVAVLIAAGGAFAVQQAAHRETPGGDAALSSSTAPDATAPATASAAPSPSATIPPGPGTAKIGVFRGTDTDEVDEFADWLGRDVDYVLDYSSRGTWGEIANPSYMLREWKNSDYRTVYAVAMLPLGEAGSIQRGATGAYDHHFEQLGRNLVRYGQEDAILRIGWEFNVSASRWRTQDAESWKTYFRRIVTAMRSVDGQEFRFDWNVNALSAKVDAPAYYPGDDVVDYLGVDTYDVGWEPGTYPYPETCDNTCRLMHQKAAWDEIYGGPRGLAFWSDFAKQHRKPMSLPEWGMWQRKDGHGGGDNPYYIQQMHAFIANPANNVAYQAYFESDAGSETHRLSKLKRGGAEFKRLFGGS